jgi:hypothetical protein
MSEMGGSGWKSDDASTYVASCCVGSVGIGWTASRGLRRRGGGWASGSDLDCSWNSALGLDFCCCSGTGVGAAVKIFDCLTGGASSAD